MLNLEKWHRRTYLLSTNRDRQRIDLWTQGEGEMYGESNMETYITTCKIDSQREFAVRLRKLKQGLCINLEGWGGVGREVGGSSKREGIDVCLWLIHIEV